MKRIVLIDDDRDDAELFGEALETIDSSWHLLHFENAQSALAALETKQDDLPEMIFLDLNLPVMSGWEVLKQLKKHHHLSLVSVIIYTTSSQTREKELAYTLGASGFITKPSDYNELIQVLDNTLNKQ